MRETMDKAKGQDIDSLNQMLVPLMLMNLTPTYVLKYKEDAHVNG